MANIQHNIFLDPVNDVFTDTIDRGVLQLHVEAANFSGSIVGLKKWESLTQAYILAGSVCDYLEKNPPFLYQTIERAIQLKFEYTALGLTASFEKGKPGAAVEEKFAYLQTSDNYTFGLMGLLECK